MIFLSHSSSDKDLAERILSYLESHGHRCWIAPRDIPPGADWAEAIIDGIDEASGMVLVLSGNSNKSPQVRREIERAVSRGLTIVPLVIEELELSKWMQYYLSAHQWHDAAQVPLDSQLPELLKVFASESGEPESDLSDLASLLGSDLDRLSHALDSGDSATRHLLPGERRRAAILHVRVDIPEGTLPRSVSETLSNTIASLVTRFAHAFGGFLEEHPKGYRCVFGLEQAVEDDSSRALGCGIRLFNGFGELNTVLRRRGLSVDFGIGVASGMIELEGRESGSRSSRGKAIDIAESLSAEASNELLASASVHHDCSTRFSWEPHSKDKYRIADYSLLPTEARMLSLRSIFVGRGEELSVLDSLLQRQSQGMGRNPRGGARHLEMGVKGEAGIGKSRLVHEFVEKHCTGDDMLVLKGQTLSYAQPSYWLWTSLLRKLLGIEHGSGLDYGGFLERLTACSEDESLLNSAPFMSKLLSIHSGDRRLDELDDKAIALETRMAFRNLVRALAARHRLLVVLEDLHWLDETDRTVLEFVASNCDTEEAVIFLLLYRPERQDGSDVEFQIHSNYAEVGELSLGEVDDSASSDLMRMLLAELSGEHNGTADAKVQTFVLQRSRGNPFFLEELILDLVESETLAEQDGHWGLTRPLEDIFVPDSITGLLQSRLDRLPEAWRVVLQHASVLGMEFQLRLYQTLANRLLLGRPRLDTFDSLERKQMLSSEASAFERKYLFRHILVHDTAYSSNLPENLTKLHRAAAESIEEMYEGEAGLVSGILMHHWDKAGDVPKTLEWGIVALEESRKNYRNEEALTLADRLESLLAEHSPEDDEYYIKVLNNREQVLDILGRRDEQELVMQRLMELARMAGRGNQLVSVLQRSGELSKTRGRMEEASSHFQQALAIAREVGFRRGEGVVLTNLGNLHYSHGRMEEASSHFQQALAIAREVGFRRSEGIALTNLGNLHYSQGSMEEALSYFQHALAVYREVGDRGGEGVVLINLGNLDYSQGRVHEAQTCYEQALAILREVGYRRGEGSALGNLGNLHYSQGRVHEALSYYEQALAILGEVGDRRGEGVALGNLGRLYHSQGSIEEALSYFQQALAILREVGFRRGEGVVLTNLGDLHCSQGSIEEALSYFQQALAILREVGYRRFEGIALGNLGRLHHSQGSMEEALACFEETLEIAREVGDRLNEAKTLGQLGSCQFDTGKPEEAMYSYTQAFRIITDIKPGKEGGFDGFIELHDKLLAAGYSPEEVPWPEHWEPLPEPPESADRA